MLKKKFVFFFQRLENKKLPYKCVNQQKKVENLKKLSLSLTLKIEIINAKQTNKPKNKKKIDQ